MSDIERPPASETDETDAGTADEDARPGTAAEEAGIVDQQAVVLEQMGEDARTVDD